VSSPGWLPPPSKAIIPRSVARIGGAVVGLLGVVAGIQVLLFLLRLGGSGDATSLGQLAAIVELPLIVTFLIWFFRVRRNAGLWGPQRLGQWWSIGGWVVPVVFCWFPYWITVDAWRASAADPASPTGRPAAAALSAEPPSYGIGRSRSDLPRVVIAWWICWLLAWVTAVRVVHTVVVNADGTESQGASVSAFLGATVASNLFGAAAAILLIPVVRRLTAMQEARLAASNH
jgi:Domain of unknown function (DUF4328)